MFEKHLLYSASWDKTVKVWDTRVRTVSTVAILDDFVNSIAFSQDKQKIAVGCVKGKVAILDINAKRVENIIQPVSETLLEILYSAYGKIISAGDKNVLSKNEIEVRLSELPEVGSDIWLDLNLGDIGEIFDMLQEPGAQTVYLATERKGLLKSLDGKTNWKKIDRDIKGVVIALAMDDKKVLCAVTKSKGVYISEDDGKTWKEDNDGLFPKGSEGIYQKMFDIEVQSKINKWFIATEKGIFRKEKKWENISDKIVTKLCFSPKNPRKLYTGTKKGGLFFSNDSGKSWNLLLEEKDKECPIKEITIDTQTEDIFVARGNEGVLVSDDGKNFRNRNYGLPPPPDERTVYSIKINPLNGDNIFIATDKGVFTTKNKGDSWKEYSDGLPSQGSPKKILVSDTGRILTGGSSGLFEVGKVKEKKVISPINFETDSDRIKPEAYPVLDNIAASVKNREFAQIIVNGHTDNVGDAGYNLKLSLRRAEGTKTYFVEQGILSERVRAFGFGLEKPLVSNLTEGGRAKNRRVEILIAE